MSQLYARVFVQILDSSIAENWQLRHVFEDLLKLCNFRSGVVDMTRQALSRRLNIPLDIINDALTKLESPDPASRDSDFEGRRIERLDEHRDWGWKILNWEKYESIRTKAASAERALRYRERKQNTAEPAPAKAIKKLAEVHIPDSLNASSDFVKWWGIWLEHLSAKRKPPTPHAMELQLRKLEKLGAIGAVETIQHCIEHNWQSIFENHATNQQSNKKGYGADRNAGIVGHDPGKAERVIAARKAKEQAAADALAAQVAGPGSDAPGCSEAV